MTSDAANIAVTEDAPQSRRVPRLLVVIVSALGGVTLALAKGVG